MAKKIFTKANYGHVQLKKQNIQTCHSYGHTELNLVYEAYLKIQSGACMGKATWEILKFSFLKLNLALVLAETSYFFKLCYHYHGY